jgi:hypothetical protein
MTKSRKHTLNLTSWELLALEAALNLLAKSGKIEPLSISALQKKVAAA